MSANLYAFKGPDGKVDTAFVGSTVGHLLHVCGAFLAGGSRPAAMKLLRDARRRGYRVVRVEIVEAK